uniref:Uncharacterized protein n=1 Tax=Arundo donax TaxID=35708 RepID=A0A0A9BEZ6_ARUDO
MDFRASYIVYILKEVDRIAVQNRTL